MAGDGLVLSTGFQLLSKSARGTGSIRWGF